MNVKKGYKKGQAVMEYLVTYGLALFVILLVLAILVAVVLPTLRAPEACQFTQPGFGCSTKDHVIVANADNELRLIFQLDNQQGKPVDILGVICSSEPPGNIDKADIADYGLDLSADPYDLSSGESVVFGGDEPAELSPLPCVDADGDVIELGSGDSFKGTVAIAYEFDQDVSGAPTRIALATLSGSVQSE